MLLRLQAEMETPDFMVQLRAQLESAASESGSGKSGSNSTSQGANSSDIRCVEIATSVRYCALQSV